MGRILKFHTLSAIALAIVITLIAAGQLSATATIDNANSNNNNRPLQSRSAPRSRFGSYYNDPYYNSRNSRYFNSRNYYNRQYYDNLFKRYNPAVVAPQARIIQQDVRSNHDGTYAYSYETENGINAGEHGTSLKAGTKEQTAVVEGSYSYVAPDGLRVIVRYRADENGYHPIISYDGANAERFRRLSQPADIVITR